jgi:formylglycine-generating enzyme required for sulfatase activity
MRPTKIATLFICTLIILSSGCLKEDNPPADDTMQGFWGSYSTNKTDFLKLIDDETAIIQGGMFSLAGHDTLNATSMYDYALLKDFKISTSRITAQQFAIFLNKIGCDNNGFYLGKKYVELSSSIWYGFDDKQKINLFSGDPNLPATNITWLGAQAFCNWVGGRLPTETEWLYASQAKNENGNLLLMGIHGSDSENSYNKNNQLLSEWCFDWFSDVYQFDGIVANPIGPISGSNRTFRGGGTEQQAASNNLRQGIPPDSCLSSLGFRCVWDMEGQITDDIEITTLNTTEVSSTTAQLNCRIDKDGGATSSIQCIFVWDTLPKPDFKRCAGIIKSKGGEHRFSAKISGLNFDKEYYVVSYAVNAAGIKQGQEIKFRTLPVMIGYNKGLIDMELCEVKGGSYTRGTEQITLNSFAIGKYEITNKQFCEYLNAVGALEINSYLSSGIHLLKEYAGAWVPEAGFENYPVVNVVWGKAAEFCKWAGGRLPSAAEWEYAAKGGQHNLDFDYAGSNSLEDVGWYYNNAYNFHVSDNSIHSVGQKQPNKLGIYDMSGNAAEWCSNLSNNTSAITKGGSVNDVMSSCRITAEKLSGFNPVATNSIGFRIVKDLEKVSSD